MSQYPEGLARIGRMLPPTTTLLTGAPREPETGNGDPDDNPGYNSLLAIDNKGEMVASYDKTHLVPFGEYLPFADFWKLFGIRQFVPGTNGWAPGTGKRLVTAPGVPAFIALICYEAIFSGDLGRRPGRRRSSCSTSPTTSGSAGSIGPAQHAHHALLRAVESGLPMLRDTNSGVTFIADPLGRITASLPEGQPPCSTASVPGKLPPHPVRPLRQLAVPGRRAGWGCSRRS